jgi:hypothetical protein
MKCRSNYLLIILLSVQLMPPRVSFLVGGIMLRLSRNGSGRILPLKGHSAARGSGTQRPHLEFPTLNNTPAQKALRVLISGSEG